MPQKVEERGQEINQSHAIGDSPWRQPRGADQQRHVKHRLGEQKPMADFIVLPESLSMIGSEHHDRLRVHPGSTQGPDNFADQTIDLANFAVVEHSEGSSFLVRPWKRSSERVDRLD